MKEKIESKKIAMQITAAALTAAMLTVSSQNIIHAAASELRSIQLVQSNVAEQTRNQELYTVGNTYYENNAGTPKGNRHDCQHLGLWLPKGVTFRIRQTNTKFGQDMTLKLRNDDKLTESVATLKKDGSWLEVTPVADSVPLISSLYSANGEKPEVEFSLEGTHELPVYEFGDDESAFYKKWDDLNAPFAVYRSKYTIWLVPARDKTNNSVGSLDDLLLWYDNMIAQYNAFTGLSLDAEEAWNRDSGTRFFIKANRHGAGAAYYSIVETAPNHESLSGYMNTGNWGPLHEVGHGYDTVNFNSAEIWNNVLSHYYQVAAFGAGRWLNLSENGRAEHENQRSSLGYFKTQSYGSKLYFWVNMLDKLGPQKTSAYAYQLYRGNKDKGIANLGGHDFYVDAYTKGSGYNVSAWFDMWGFTVSDSVKQALIEAEVYKNIYPLRNLIDDDVAAETIRTTLGLVSKYSMVETRELQEYFKNSSAIKGKLSVRFDDTALAATKGRRIRITDGVNTVAEVEITGADTTVELPVGLYSIFIPAADNSNLVIINNRVGYAAVTQGETAVYEVTAEKSVSGSEFADWLILFGSNYGYNGTFCTAKTDIARGTLHITSIDCKPHGYIPNFAHLKVYDDKGNVVYTKMMDGTGTTAENTTIPIKLGYTIEVFHANHWRGMTVQSTLQSAVKLMNNDLRTATFEVTSYGLKMQNTEGKSDLENYYVVLSDYMNSLKAENKKADFQNSSKFPEEKTKIIAAVSNMPAEWQAKFKTDYAGYYPFDNGVREFVIADISAQDYTGLPVAPDLDVSLDGAKLEKSDYRAEWLMNIDVGTAKVRVYGLGGFENCVGEKSFDIKLPDNMLKTFTVESEYVSVEFSNGAKRPKATVKLGDKILTRGVDYILSYNGNTSAGTASVTANGIGNYRGISGSTTFEIISKIVPMTVTTSPDKLNHTGSEVTTGISVMAGKTKLTEGRDFTVSFENNTNVGIASAIIDGVGNYAGSTGRGSFEITQPIESPEEVGGSLFSNWTYKLDSWYSGLFSIMKFDMEKGELTIEHRNSNQPHSNYGGPFASVAVFDSNNSRCYYKGYIGNKNNVAPADTVKLGLGYTVEIYVAEPGRNSTFVYSEAVPEISMRPKTAKYLVTPCGLKEITADGGIGSGDLACKYDEILRAYMDKLKNDHTEEAFRDNTQFPDEKAAVEKGVYLLTEDQFAQFRKDYIGYYPFAAYTVLYDWGDNAPPDKILPTDRGSYNTEEEALAAKETSFTSTSVSTAQKNGADGTWAFSGWDSGIVSGTVITFRGTWVFTEKDKPVTSERPDTDKSYKQDKKFFISAPDQVPGGSVSLSHRYAERGELVTLTVKPSDGYELDKLSVLDSKGNKLNITAHGGGVYAFTMSNGRVDVKVTFRESKQLSFVDVSAEAYYAKAVQWAAENKITAGVGDGKFSPDNFCTRAQIVTFLWRAAGSPEPQITTNPFADVSKDDYYYRAVLWAVENGITDGTGNGLFSPEARCTRSQSVTFLYRCNGSPNAGESNFSDVEADSYYAKAVAWAAANAITGGTGYGQFSPTDYCTRGQIATFLFRSASAT